MAIKSKDSTKWQIISHVALMFFALSLNKSHCSKVFVTA